MADPLHAITMAAADLKLAAPDQFDKLVAAFVALEEKCDKEFTAAGPDVIFGAQGKRWLSSQLRARLENCLDQKRTYDQRK